jgi:hypothetical protein
MTGMNDQNLAHFEAQLERIIEGAFAQVFSRSVRAQDIALHLARAMEGEARTADGDPRPLAPDRYVIRLNPDVRATLLSRQPRLPEILSHHLVELANEAGYRLNADPIVRMEGDATFSPGDVSVSASHTVHLRHDTDVMERTDLPIPATADRPANAQLIINGDTTINMTEPLVNLGRSRDNHVVLDDPYVSRHHAQIRLRFGRYTLFDTQSQTGTYVNDTRVREHNLQTGDVIRMGRITMVYLEDDPFGESQTRIDAASDL